MQTKVFDAIEIARIAKEEGSILPLYTEIAYEINHEFPDMLSINEIEGVLARNVIGVLKEVIVSYNTNFDGSREYVDIDLTYYTKPDVVFKTPVKCSDVKSYTTLDYVGNRDLYM